MALPPDLAAAADKIDARMAAATQASTPVVTASPQVLNLLVRAFNDMAPLFGAPPYPEFTAPLQGEPLPVDFVKALSMVQLAAQQADVPVPDLDVKDEGDIKVLAGELAALAKDRDFVRFLKSKPEMESEDDEVSVSQGVMAQEAVSTPADDMALFASRMK